MAESVIKRAGCKGFTTVYRDVAQDRRLTLKARGLFLLMQSLPEDWSYTISGLAGMAGTGKDQIRNALNEMLETGYLVKEQTHDDAGKFAGNVYILQEQMPPLSGNPTTGNPITGKPSTGNPTVREYINIHNPPISPQGDGEEKPQKPQKPQKQKKRKSKSVPDWKPERFEGFWSFYRDNARGEDRAGAVREWDRLQPDDALIDTMAKALAAQVASRDWQRGIGIPYACRWLSKERWKDAGVAAKAPAEPQEPRQMRFVGTRVVDGQEVDVYE